jgi:hypothetical protein
MTTELAGYLKTAKEHASDFSASMSRWAEADPGWSEQASRARSWLSTVKQFAREYKQGKWAECELLANNNFVKAEALIVTPIFPLTAGAELSGIAYNTAKRWIMKGVICPIVIPKFHGAGRAQPRVLSGWEIMVMRALAAMSAVGIPPTEATGWADQVPEFAIKSLLVDMQDTIPDYAVTLWRTTVDGKLTWQANLLTEAEQRQLDAYSVLNAGRIARETLNTIYARELR